MQHSDGAGKIEPIKLLRSLEGSQMRMAHDMLEEAIRVSKSSRALVVWREAYRSPPDTADMAAASLIGIGLFCLTTWWIALPVTGAVVFWRTRQRALKMRRDAKRGGHSRPDIPEFQNLWALNSWKLVPLVRGFNFRAEATNRLIRSGKKLDSARRMAELLLTFRGQLKKATGVLEGLKPVKVATATVVQCISLAPNQTVNNQLSLIDPLGIGAGSVALDWLSLVRGPIAPDSFDEILERDLAVAFDAQEALKDATTEARYADLESKYGADLDRELGIDINIEE